MVSFKSLKINFKEKKKKKRCFFTSNDKRRANKFLWSFLDPMIDRKFSATQKFLLHRPSVEFWRRCFSPMLNLVLLNSRNLNPMDKDKEDFDTMCEANKFLVEEILNILWSVVLCRLYKVLNDLIEDRDNNRLHHPDEFDWIRNESKLNENDGKKFKTMGEKIHLESFSVSLPMSVVYENQWEISKYLHQLIDRFPFVKKTMTCCFSLKSLLFSFTCL